MASTGPTDSKEHFAGASAKTVSEKLSSLVKITHPKTSGIYPRKRLFRLIDKYRESPVVWISAPAGSGKTTLASSYLSERGLNSIWYRVDEGDRDIATFFYYMGLAAKKAASHTKKSLPLLTPEYLQGIPAFTLRYFEELFGCLKPPFVIVLDNYQHIQNHPLINEVVSSGLDIIPEGINVILISREEPPPQFSRLRAGDKISFLGKDEIVFTLDESRTMLRLKGFRDFSDNMIKRLHDRTRGWAAGLVLIMERARRKGFDERILTGVTPAEILDYFAVEIFEKTDAETKDFLLRTAFLPGMTVSAAESLSGIARSEEILYQLHEDLFFTEKNTDNDPVYRYHPLFRDFLLSMAERSLSPHEITITKRKAAALLMEAGRMEDAAILLMEAGDWEGFISFIIDYAPTLMAQGRTKTLSEWLDAIPVEMVEKSPWLLYWTGQCSFILAPAEGRAYLERAFLFFTERGDDSGALMSWAGIADTFIYDFDYFKPLDRWIDWLDERVCRDGSFPTPEIESAVSSSMVGALVWRRPGHPRIRQWIERALSSSQKSSDSAIRLLALRRALLHYIWTGDKGSCLDLLVEINRIVESHSAPPAGLIAAKMLKAHYYAWLGDESDRALQFIEEGFSLANITGVHVVDSFLAIQGAFAAINKGDLKEAVRYVSKLESTLGAGRRYVVFHHFIQSMISLQAGNPAEAQAHGLKMLELSAESGHPFPEAWARTLIAQAAYETGDIASAEKGLAAAERFFQSVESHIYEFSTLLIRAYFLLGKGKESQGMEILDKALKLGLQKGYTSSSTLSRSKVWSILCAKALGAGIEVEYVRALIRKRRLSPPSPTSECENWPWPVNIYTLGRFEVFIDGKRLEFSGKPPRRILSLLKSIVAFGVCGTNEEKLIDFLWPDSDGDVAHDSFSVAIHRLRQLLGNEKALIMRDGCPRLDPSICWVDAHAFEELLDRAEGEGPDEGERLRGKALALYKGQFLEESGESWLISCRERLRNKFLRAVWRRGDLLEESGRFDLALELYRRGLDADQLAEELYRRIMRCHRAAGRRCEAISAYERCKKILRSVLGIDPSRETEALYRSLL